MSLKSIFKKMDYIILGVHCIMQRINHTVNCPTVIEDSILIKWKCCYINCMLKLKDVKRNLCILGLQFDSLSAKFPLKRKLPHNRLYDILVGCHYNIGQWYIMIRHNVQP